MKNKAGQKKHKKKNKFQFLTDRQILLEKKI